jgi:hypothetical protein
MFSKAAIAQLDKFYGPCGPCAFCGHHDKRHRLWDVFLDNYDDDTAIAAEFGVSTDYVRAVRIIRPYRRDGKLLFPMESSHQPS